MANLLTFIRIIGTFALIPLSAATPAFYLVYIICGLTDVLDGMVARATKTANDFGAKLDRVADILFYSIILIRLFPLLYIQIPSFILWWMLLIIAIRIASYIFAYKNKNSFSSLHTIPNKITGILVFLIPFFLGRSILPMFCIMSCAAATFSAAQELYLNLKFKHTKGE